MSKNYRAELSDFGWAVTWDGESALAFAARQAKRFCAGHPVHGSAEEAMAAYRRRYLKGRIAPA